MAPGIGLRQETMWRICPYKFRRWFQVTSWSPKWTSFGAVYHWYYKYGALFPKMEGGNLLTVTSKTRLNSHQLWASFRFSMLWFNSPISSRLCRICCVSTTLLKQESRLTRCFQNKAKVSNTFCESIYAFHTTIFEVQFLESLVLPTSSKKSVFKVS